MNGKAHSPDSVTDTTIGIPKKGAANGIITIQPTQIRAINLRVNANCLSFNPCSRAADTALFCFGFHDLSDHSGYKAHSRAT